MMMTGKINTVEKAIAPLERVRANLAAVAESRKADCTAKREEAARLEREAKTDQEECDRAKALEAKFNELLGVQT